MTNIDIKPFFVFISFKREFINTLNSVQIDDDVIRTAHSLQSVSGETL